MSSSVTVSNVAATASFTGLPATDPAGTAITLTGSATDPSTAVSAAGYTFSWTVSGPSTNLTGTGASFSFTPEYGGSYNVSLTATDKLNELASTAVSSSVTVSNVAPTALFSGLPATDPAGTAITLTGSATDPSTAVSAAGYTFSWTVSGPSTSLTGTGSSFSFTPEYGGSYSVSLTATDKLNELTSTAATSSVTVSNVAPSASFTGLPATDPAGTAITLTGSATDPSTAVNTAGYTFSWTVSGPSTTFTGTGSSFSFTPEYGGSYSVSLTATDKLNELTSTAATSSVTVSNVAPTASFTGLPATDPAGTALTLTGSATDPSTAVNAAGYTFSWTVSGPSTSLTGTGSSFSFTPEYRGSYNVSLTATDKLNDLTSTVVSSSVTVSNVAPTASFTGLPATDPAGTAITLTGSATDPSTADAAAGFTFNWTVSGPGSISFTGTSTTANPGYTFTPVVAGSYTVAMTAVDSNGLSGSTSENLRVLDVAPALGAISAPSTVSSGMAFSVSAKFTDPDPSVSHTALWSWGDSTTSAGTVTAPNGSTPGLVTGSHTYMMSGSYTITLTVTGSDGLTAQATAQVGTNQSIIVLDPTAGGALSLSGNATIKIAGILAVDSSSTTALSASGSASVSASSIQVVGKDQKSGNATLSPAPTTGAAAVADPLAGLASPSTSGLTTYGSESLSGNSNATIKPGIYSSDHGLGQRHA